MDEEKQYPKGKELLWMVHFMPQNDQGEITTYGSMDGHSIKLNGTIEEAAKEAAEFAQREGYVIQCIRRRY